MTRGAPTGRAVALTLALFTLYLFTLCPTVHWLDTGELVTGAFHLSVPHPPGEPVWVMLARGAALLPAGDVPQRMAFLSALAAALCLPAALAAAAAWGGSRGWGSSWAGLMAAAAPCLTYPLWVQGVRAEVYALHTALTLTTLALLGHASAARPRPWMLAALVGGLAAGVHPLLAGLAIAPAIALAALSRGLPRGGALGTTAGLALLGLGSHLLLPVRVAAGAPGAWGLPDRWGPFVDTLLARTFQQNFAPASWGLMAQNLGIQWEAVSQGSGGLIPLLAAVGLVALLRRGAWRGALIAALAAGATLGAKLTQSMVFSTNVDLHGYLGLVHVALWALAAAGLAALAGALPLSPAARRLLPAAAIGALAALAALAQGPEASRSGDDLARRHGLVALDAPPTGGTLVTSGNNTMFITLYLQRVEGYRPDVRAVHRSLVGHPWYRRDWASAPRPAPLSWVEAARGRPSSLGILGTPVVVEARQRDLVDAAWLCPAGPDAGWGFYAVVTPGACPPGRIAGPAPGLAALWGPFPGDVDARLVAGLAAETLAAWRSAGGRGAASGGLTPGVPGGPAPPEGSALPPAPPGDEPQQAEGQR